LRVLKSNIEVAQQLLLKDLDIDDPGLIFSKMEALQNWLAGEIAVLLDRDFQRLLNILYRIDINESKVKLAFTADKPAWEIAGLIIERELKKVATRREYSR
jgi:hypothetical protein